MELTQGININVKATLSVDEHTVHTCVELLNIYAKSKGAARIVIEVPIEDDWHPAMYLE